LVIAYRPLAARSDSPLISERLIGEQFRHRFAEKQDMTGYACSHILNAAWTGLGVGDGRAAEVGQRNVSKG
jgi:hypothetical protein